MTAPTAVPTRVQILTAAARLYGEHGFRGTTTRRIAEEAGVNEVTIFRLFGSKAALLDAAIRANAQLHSIGLPEDPSDPVAELSRWATAEHRAMTECRAMIRTAMGELEERPSAPACVAEGPAGAHHQLREYLRTLMRRGLVAPDTSIDVAAAMLMGALFSDAIGRDMMPSLFPHSASDAPAAYVRLTLAAIGFNHGVVTKLQRPAPKPRRAS
jgi:AcrR family transcriptional regulator